MYFEANFGIAVLLLLFSLHSAGAGGYYRALPWVTLLQQSDKCRICVEINESVTSHELLNDTLQ